MVRNTSLSEIATTAVHFGSHACTHYDNYITESFARELIPDTGY
jgi:hypothetical protein